MSAFARQVDDLRMFLEQKHVEGIRMVQIVAEDADALRIVQTAMDAAVAVPLVIVNYQGPTAEAGGR